MTDEPDSPPQVARPSGWYAHPSENGREAWWTGLDWDLGYTRKRRQKTQLLPAPGPGYYANPRDAALSAWWTGSEWDYQRTEPRSEPTQAIGASVSIAELGAPSMNADNSKPKGWPGVGIAMYAIGSITALSALIAGIALIAHKTTTYGGLISDERVTHPFTGAGIAVLIGGLLNSVLWFVVGALCRAQGNRATAGH